MAMLHELVKNGVSAKLKRGCCTYIWNGNQLMYDNEAVKAGNAVILDKNWELDQPTVEDVLRERGYCWFLSRASNYAIQKVGSNCPLLEIKNKPTTSAEAIRIIDFIESLGGK